MSQDTKNTEKQEINNLELYNFFKGVPEEAKKPIKGGRLSGMTDINPMYRIKSLTEKFGPCGIGWKTIIINKEILDGANDEKIAIVDIELYIKVNGEWSEAIPGTGGSSYISKEKTGLYTSDECFKMAYTDALSVACKSLGIGADVYWEKDRTKYDDADKKMEQKEEKIDTKLTPKQLELLNKLSDDAKAKLVEMVKKPLEELTVSEASTLIDKYKARGIL